MPHKASGSRGGSTEATRTAGQVPDFTRDFIRIPGLPNSLDLAEIDAEHVDILNIEESSVVCEKCHLSMASKTCRKMAITSDCGSVLTDDDD